MKEQYYKYANLLLKKGLCIKENQPLVINTPLESLDFIRILTEVACELGVRDIYYDWYDDTLKHIDMKYFDDSQIKNSRFWNKSIHDEYAKKDAAFLFLVSSTNIMHDISSEKLKIASYQSLHTRSLYRHLQENNEVSWCIAAIATEEWGNIIFKDDSNAKEKLWNVIFDICMINDNDPCQAWTNKMAHDKKFCQKAI